MSVHHIVGTEAFRMSGRRRSPVQAMGRGMTPTRRGRGGIDWRVVGMVAVSAVLLIAMMARA